MSDDEIRARVEDYRGDRLDAILCAIQAAWAYLKRRSGYGFPRRLDMLEGWIPDPDLLNK